MKPALPRLIFILLAVCVVMALSVFAQKPQAKQAAAMTDKGWPRTFSSGATSFSVDQPQIEHWKDNRFEARAAVAVTTGQSKQPGYGVVWFAARTEIDKVNRLVTMSDFVVTKTSFPATPDRAAAYQNLLQTQVLKTAEVIALDRLLAELAITQARTSGSGYQLKNDPPEIFFSTQPAILVLIDGEPVLRPVKETKLNRVINTRLLILQHQATGKYYLHLMDGWMESDAAVGPWTVAWNTPSDLKKALAAAAESKQVDLLDGSSDKRPSLSEAAKQNALPVIYTSQKPAELLQSQGEPRFTPIEGTDLLFVTNSENDIFLDTIKQERYVLISGRWFRGKSMNGPWEHVPGDWLPTDFARIPPTHEKASVLASVAGTPQAKEALIANEIPQTATISRSTATLTVDYDGQPEFSPIENTTLKYAVNTSTPVIAVNAGSYYAVTNGVWFVAKSARGPWAVATAVPAAIYTIPPSSPVHKVTYVKVYGSTTDAVYVGYTPGYYGTVVSSSNVVVYGTGWYYRPYIGSYWVGSSYTYGYGAGFTWSTYGGWGVAYGTGRGFTNTNVYTGTTVSGAGGTAYNPYTGRSAAGQAGAAGNAYTGNAAAGARGASYNPQTGVVSGGAAGATYNAATGQTTAAGRGFAYNTKTDTGVAVGKNNVYAGRDGEVYRYNKSDGVQQHTENGWQSVNRPTEIQNIQNHQGARATGQQRWDNFRSAGGPNGNSGVVGPRAGSGNGSPRIGSGGAGGGGFRGGGRFRR